MSPVRRRPGRTGVGRRRHRYVQQFQLAVLELERARRRHERDAAARKVNEMDLRLHELQVLIDDAHRTLGLKAAAVEAAAVEAAAPRPGVTVLPTTCVLSYGGRKS
jgi:hypothetical protein